MSKSLKKYPSVKCAEFITKADANRKFRRVNKQRINMGKEPLKNLELINPYDICDYKFTDYNDSEEYEKYKRK